MNLPENAFRELKDGEQYEPLMGPGKAYPEVNVWSVTWGIVMAVIFSAAAAYLGLKVGQVFEAAIPIAIIAVGVSTATKRQGLGRECHHTEYRSLFGCRGGGSHLHPACLVYSAGQVSRDDHFVYEDLPGFCPRRLLGILFLIPFRKYFVSDMHGKYPFPEATATTQVLVSGAKGGDQAKPLLIAGLVGGLYDFIVASFGWWNENFTPAYRLGMRPGRQGEARIQGKYGCCRARSGLHRRSEVCLLYLCRFTGCMVAHRSGHERYLP